MTVSFEWQGSKEDCTGTATFAVDDAVYYKMQLPNFDVANKLDNLLHFAYESGRQRGLDEMRAAVTQTMGSVAGACHAPVNSGCEAGTV